MSNDPAFVWSAGRSRPRPMDPPERTRPPRRSATEDRPPPQTEPKNDDPRSDAVLVPVDEWSRILHQLGNLHEAGQQLAEARERAAKAETESTFLRERLRETRDRLQTLETEAAETPEPEPEPMPGLGEWMVRRWLEKRRARSTS